MTRAADPGPCPDDNALAALVGGQPVPAALEQHVDRCPACRELLSAVGKGIAEASDLGLPLVRVGDRIDRYRVVAELGRGGMGVVMEAVDLELDRHVALKILRDGVGSDGAPVDERLMREGQAIARLEHPNVVRVYDIGVDRGRWYIALELVRGETLAAWIQSPRPWARVVEVFVACARGLAAAHDHGVIHRDFKPSNVLLDEATGTPRVTDFGLAVDAENAPSATDVRFDDSDASEHSSVVVGTPAFMAPELHFGGAATPASDQFAFCVSLYLALYGENPFPGSSARAIRKAMLAKAPRPADPSRVPRFIERAVMRGLREDPNARWPSMHALQVALMPRRRRGWRLGAAALAVAGIATALLIPEGESAAACDSGQVRWAAVWDDARAAEMSAALDRASASTAAAMVNAEIDGIGARWLSVAAATCEAAAPVAARRRLCLEGTATAVDAVVRTLLGSEAAAARRAGDLVTSVPDPDRCLDDGRLAAEPPPPGAALAGAVAEIRADAEHANALMRAGRNDEALEVVERAKRAVLDVDYAPVWAEVEYRRGTIIGVLGRHADAVAVLEGAFFAAQRSEHSRIAASSAAALASMIGYNLSRPADGAEWARHAEVELGRATHSAEVRAAVESAWGSVLAKQGRYDEALERQLRCGEIIEKAHGPEHLLLAKIWNNVGNTKRAAGDYEGALSWHRKAVAIQRKWLGERHPDIGFASINVGTVLYHLERYDEAIETLLGALPLVRDGFGEEHPAVGTAYNSLAIAYADRGDLDKSIATHLQAIELRRHTGGPNLGMSYFNLGRTQHRKGEQDAALRNYRRGTEIIEETMGPDHPYLATSLAHEGDLLLERDEVAAALELYRRAQTIAVANLEPTHPTYGQAARGVAEAEKLLR